jgi:hypothetical protein
LLYATYRLDLLSTDGTREIAPELESTTVDGGASFDEFLKYVQYSTSLQFVPESTSAGNSLIPDINQIAQELSEAVYRPNWDIQKLFERGRFTKPRIGFNKMASTAVDRIQRIRQLLGDEPIQDLLGLGRDAMIGIFQETQIYQGPAVLEALTNDLGYEPVMKTVPALDGTPFEGVDGDATEQQHPGFYTKYNQFEEMILQAPNGPLQSVRAKWRNLKFFMDLDDRLHSSCPS